MLTGAAVLLGDGRHLHNVEECKGHCQYLCALLYKDSRICFAFDPADGEYRLRVLDSALLGLSLADPFPHHSKAKPPLHADKFQAISWQDIDGKCVQFDPSCTRPFKQAFTLHAYLAWDFQLDRRCLPDSFDARGVLTSQWSCDEVSGKVSDQSVICALEAWYVVACFLTAAEAHFDLGQGTCALF